MARRPDIGKLDQLLTVVNEDYDLGLNGTARLLLVEGAKSLGYVRGPNQTWIRSGSGRPKMEQVQTRPEPDLNQVKAAAPTRPDPGQDQVQTRPESGQTSTVQGPPCIPSVVQDLKGSTSTPLFSGVTTSSAERMFLAQRQVDALREFVHRGTRFDGGHMSKTAVQVCSQAAMYRQARGRQVPVVQDALGYESFDHFYNHTKAMLEDEQAELEQAVDALEQE